MSKRFLILAAISLILTGSILGQKKTEPKIFGVNLIKNGGAESENGAGWSNSDNLKTFRYDGGWGDTWQVTPPNHGDYYFYARVAKDTPIALFTQKADVSKIEAEIDAGKVTYYLTSWYGIRAGAGVRLIASFYDANGAQISGSKGDETATEKITASNRPNFSDMVEKNHGGEVPAGTRIIKITLEFSLFNLQNENDGDTALADNLSLVLTNKGDK